MGVVAHRARLGVGNRRRLCTSERCRCGYRARSVANARAVTVMDVRCGGGIRNDSRSTILSTSSIVVTRRAMIPHGSVVAEALDDIGRVSGRWDHDRYPRPARVRIPVKSITHSGRNGSPIPAENRSSRSERGDAGGEPRVAVLSARAGGAGGGVLEGSGGRPPGVRAAQPRGVGRPAVVGRRGRQ